MRENVPEEYYYHTCSRGRTGADLTVADLAARRANARPIRPTFDLQSNDGPTAKLHS